MILYEFIREKWYLQSIMCAWRDAIACWPRTGHCAAAVLWTKTLGSDKSPESFVSCDYCIWIMPQEKFYQIQITHKSISFSSAGLVVVIVPQAHCCRVRPLAHDATDWTRASKPEADTLNTVCVKWCMMMMMKNVNEYWNHPSTLVLSVFVFALYCS